MNKANCFRCLQYTTFVLVSGQLCIEVPELLLKHHLNVFHVHNELFDRKLFGWTSVWTGRLSFAAHVVAIRPVDHH